MTAIEYGGVSLRYSDEVFSLSEKIWIVGTMNTADKSVKHIDIAFRRRFNWIPVLTDYQLIEEWAKLVESEDTFQDSEFSFRYRRFAEELNESIKEESMAGPNLQLGHVLFFPMKLIKEPKKITQ